MDTSEERKKLEVLIPVFRMMGSGEPEIIEGPGLIAMRIKMDGKVLTMTMTDDDE